MNTNHYDIIIVGGGLSGLYSGYIIQKTSPKTKFIVLESNRTPYIGGRVGNDTFYGTSVVIGAGIGRKRSDYLLQNLLHELDIPYKEFTVDMKYSPLIKEPLSIKKALTYLKKIYKSYDNPPSITFKQFAMEHLGEKVYKQFIVSSGYSDYEKEDVNEVLYHYQMEDNIPGWTGLHIHWNTLIHKLCNKICRNRIHMSAKVEKIHKNKTTHTFEITTSKNITYYAKKVIVATRINALHHLFPQYTIFKEIHGQPFLYVYAKFNKQSAEIMKNAVPKYTIVPGPLQKILPMDASKGVYMIAYCDNKHAEYLKNYVENTEKNREFFEEEVEKSMNLKKGTIHIVAIKCFYWPIGTHYYQPLNETKYKNRLEFIHKVQHPEKGILVVGEAVSRRQGWTEGALESVEKVLHKDWIEN